MTQAQINRGQMIEAVITFMNKKTAKWSAIAIIVTLMAKLNELFEAIIEHKEAQNSAQVFLHKNKNEQKRIVADKADILNDTLAAYAAIEEKAELEQKADKSSSDLYKLRNEDFKTVITETITLLDENLENMTDYAMSEPQISDLKTSFDNFLVLTGQPRQYRISSSVATESLKELFSSSNELFEKRLDRVMKRFKNSDPKFYKGYLAARVVVDN